MKRESWLDSAKGIGILLVVLGHSNIVTSGLKDFIYSFHMPLFFLISGFVFNESKYSNSSFRSFLGLRAKQYLIPYAIMAFINYMITAVGAGYLKYGLSPEYGQSLLKYLAGILYANPTREWMPECTPLWFLPALFLASMLFFCIIKYSKNKYMQFGLVALAFTSSVLLSQFNVPVLFWNANTALRALSYMYVGILLKRGSLIETTKPSTAVSVLAAGVIAALFSLRFNYDAAKGLQLVLLSLLSLFAATAISTGILWLCRHCCAGNSRVLTFFGKGTMMVMGFNYLAIIAADLLADFFGPYSSITVFHLASFIITVLLLAILIVYWNTHNTMIANKRSRVSNKSTFNINQ